MRIKEKTTKLIIALNIRRTNFKCLIVRNNDIAFFRNRYRMGCINNGSKFRLILNKYIVGFEV